MSLLLYVDGVEATSVRATDLPRRLLGALQTGKPIVIAPPVTLQDAAKAAFDMSYDILLSGVVARYTSSGKPSYTAKVWRGTTSAQRECRQGKPSPPSAVEGKPQRLVLFCYYKATAVSYTHHRDHEPDS